MKFDMQKLLGLRPKGKMAADLRMARDAANAAQEMAIGRLLELEAGRGDVLIDGRAELVAEHEAQLAEARADMERAEVLAAALAPRIAAAEREELVAEMRRLRAEAERAAQEVADWWRSEYAKLAGMIALGLQGEQKALAAVEQMEKVRQKAFEMGAKLTDEDQSPIVLPVQRVWGVDNAWPLMASVKLPPAMKAVDAAGSEPWIWPQVSGA